MDRIIFILAFLVLVGCSDTTPPAEPGQPSSPLSLQLNWFHDPTFAGEYAAKELLGDKLTIFEGGVNINPIQKLKSGLADIAVVGIDIALKAIESDIQLNGKSELRIVYVDFQRNPVGWIIHPAVAEKYGMPNVQGKRKNDWLFEKFLAGDIRPGDKRGTETTAIWTAWRNVRKLDGVNVLAVGFDPTIVLDAPNLAYPVYMNEEPYKLGEKIGAPVIVFDPADDGIELYGNVLVTTVQALDTRSIEIQGFLSALSEGWIGIHENPEDALALVKSYYKDVSDNVVLAQIAKTVEFVFFKTNTPGGVDISNAGRLEDTVTALRLAGSLDAGSGLKLFSKYVIPYEKVPQ